MFTAVPLNSRWPNRPYPVHTHSSNIFNKIIVDKNFLWWLCQFPETLSTYTVVLKFHSTKQSANLVYGSKM